MSNYLLIWIFVTLINRAYTSPLTISENDDALKSSMLLVLPDLGVESLNKVEKAAEKITETLANLESVALNIEALVSRIMALENKKLDAAEDKILQPYPDFETIYIPGENKKPEAAEDKKTQPRRDFDSVSIPGDDGVVYKKYIIIYDGVADFETAIGLCKVIRTEGLASIQNQREFDLLTEHLVKHYKEDDQFWISGNYSEKKRKYVSYSKGSEQEAEIDDSWWLHMAVPDTWGAVYKNCLGLSYQESAWWDEKIGFKISNVRCEDSFITKYAMCEEYLHQKSSKEINNK